MCQELISLTSIRKQGILPLFEQANNEGMISVMFEPKDLAITEDMKVPFGDLINHLLLRILELDHFVSHRIRCDQKHYKNIQASIFWHERGSLEFSFSLSKLMCIPAHKLPDVQAFLMVLKDLMHHNPGIPVKGIVNCNGSVSIEPVKDNALWPGVFEQINDSVRLSGPQCLFDALKVSLSSCSKQFYLTETTLFPSMLQPHRNFCMHR